MGSFSWVNINGGQAVLSWPGSGVGLALYSATNLTPPVTWTEITNAPVFTNGLWEIQFLNVGSEAHFYRMQSL